jgi:tetratricopeptide (TPR) repeat protein
MLSAMGQVNKKPMAALATAEKLLRLDPMNPQFIQLLVQAAQAAELPEIGLQTLEVAQEHSPKDAHLIEQLGRLYLEVNDTKNARACFEKLVNLRPKDQKALKALKDAAALDTMKSGGWDAAGSYRDVMKDAKTAELLEQQGRATQGARGSESLIQDTLQKIQSEPENLNYRRALADLYTRSDRFEEAETVLGEALAMTGGTDPDLDRALADTRIKAMDRAIKEKQEAGDAEGLAQAEAQKQAFVFENTKERVHKYPNDLQFKYDLGVLHYERGEITEAIQQFQLAQNNPQRRISALYYMALCFKAKKQYDIASSQLEKAVAEMAVMDQAKKDTLYELGSLAELMGQPEKAAGYFKEIYAVDIGFRDVAQKIEGGYETT